MLTFRTLGGAVRVLAAGTVLSCHVLSRGSPPPQQQAADAQSLAQLLPRIPPRSPEESLKAFQVEPGFRVELVAAEPQISDPVDVAWDENGNLYVCELWNYPGEPKPGEPLGRVRLLSEPKDDGTYAKSTVFADNVRWPGGVLPWRGGVFVLSVPDLWYFKDTDGDGKADWREKRLTGFAGRTYEVANSLRWGPDGWVYISGSYAGGNVVTVPVASGPPVRSRDFRYDPRSNTLESVTGGGEWGQSFDDWGERFTCDATHLVWHPVLPHEALARNPFLATTNAQEMSIPEWQPIYPTSRPEPWKRVRQEFWSRWRNTNSDMRAGRFPPNELAPQGFATSAAGITIYRGDGYPPEYQGNAFIGEPANNAVVRLVLKPNGVGIKAERAERDIKEKREFLSSSDNWFRPVNFATGPDGCLYVISMYREVIEDETAIPHDILKHLDLYSGRERGRIYRIVPENFHRPRPPRLQDVPPDRLVPVLANPNGWWRETAYRLLKSNFEELTITAETMKVLARESPLPQGRVQALWAAGLFLRYDDKTLLAALADRHPRVREVAARIADGRLGDLPAVTERLITLATDDPDPRVRFRAVLTLSSIEPSPKDAAVAEAVGRYARRDLADQWARQAALIAAARRAGALFASLANDAQFVAQPAAGEFLGQLALVVGSSKADADIRQVLGVAPTLGDETGRAVVRQLADGLARAGGSLAGHLADVRDEALRRTLDALFDKARATAADSKKPLRRRVEAVRLLTHEPLSKSQAVLVGLLEPDQPYELKVAAVRALSAHDDPTVGKLLADRWRAFGPAARPEVVEALFRRTERLAAVLDAIEAHRMTVAELDPARRQALLTDPDAAIRERAKSLLGAQQAANRQELIDRYRAAVLKLKGDPRQGAVLFQNNCATCHRFKNVGQSVGPDLASLPDRSPDALLPNILDPNREVKPNFVGYAVETTDGQTLTGVIASETVAALTLRRAGGGEDTVLRTRVKRLASTGLSLMPEGLEGALNEQQMADLLNYLAPGQ